MTKTNRQSCLAGIALLLFLSNQLFAQVREPFDQLNLNSITSDFFYPQTYKDIPIPDPHSFNDTLDYKIALRLMSYFDKACLNENNYFHDFSDFTHGIFQKAQADGIIPITILDITYHDFKDDALASNYFSFDGTKFYDLPNQADNPYKEMEAFITWIGAETFESGVLKFQLATSNYITNRSSMPTKIYIDFDDGNGFRQIDFDLPISIEYSNYNSDRCIRTFVQHENEEEHRSLSILLYDLDFHPCETTQFPFPNDAPWSQTDTESHLDPGYDEGIATSQWFMSVPYEDRFVRANTYTLTSDDNVFDKPFIFVEGIDFGRDNNLMNIHSEYQNGTFGWCQFSSGFLDPNPTDEFEYGYDMLHPMRDFLNVLRSNGYDIVMVDFYDGAEKMQINAAIVERVINLCNEHKIGNELLVVAGASMGGQITRFALRDMELNGINPCTRLWISLDSPHAGANIPAALQEAIDFNADQGMPDAISSKEIFLQCNAARQLLNYQLNGDLIERNAWYSMIDQMGYPESCRSVAISNGMGNGTPIRSTLSPLMDWQCDVVGSNVLREYLFPNSGNPMQLGPGGFLFGDFKTVVTGSNAASDIEWIDVIGFLNPIIGVIGTLTDIEERKVYTTPGNYNWDYAPGGVRKSLRSFYFAIKNSLEESVLNGECAITENNFYDNHSFVTSTSAIGISGIDPYTNLYNYLSDHPEQKHFDRIEFALENNEQHSEVTEHNLQIILEEVLNFEFANIGEELSSNSPNNGTFNYGKQELTTLRNIHIHDGGHLFINRFLPTHFASSNDITEDNDFFEVTTHSCSSADVLIDHGGSLEIGDPDIINRSANIILNRDSRITVGTDGTLKIFKDSKLIINEGAELIIYPGALVFVDNGSIVVNEGGKIIFKEGEIPGTVNDITLLNDDANILIDGGQIQIENNTEFTVNHEGGTSGYIKVMPGSTDVLINGENSIFTLSGDSNEDIMLIVTDHAIFENTNFQQGEIHLFNCKVDLSGYGIFKTDMKVIANHVTFHTVEQMTNLENSIFLTQYNNPEFSNSTFIGVLLKNKYGFCKINQSNFSSNVPGFQCTGGGYNIKNSNFDDSAINSNSLQNVSAVSDCNFTNTQANKIYDFSLVELKVNHCSFDYVAYYPSIEKKGGKLSVFCSEFHSEIGIKMENGELNLSGADMAGYNDFSHTQTCIQLVNASGIKLYKGHNDFSGGHYFLISGTMNIPCLPISGCHIYLDALNNYWGLNPSNSLQTAGTNLRLPQNSNFNLHTAAFGSCSGPESKQTCSIHFKDMTPVLPTGCPTLKPLEVKSSVFESENNFQRVSTIERHSILKNDVQNDDSPTINTFHFENVSLDSALIYSATQMEAYNSLGSDNIAIELFHEILMDSLDQTNQEVKRKMNWGRYNMKTALENMFIQQELSPENNHVTFEQPVQKYVDVLNLMTETTLTDSTYRLQFYLELDKGQFFRTLNKPQIAQQIFAHLDECQLDSLEQTILNEWRQQNDEDLSFIHQSLVLDLPIDSIDTAVDTSNYSVPMTIEVSNYYFGLWIDSPNSITFVSCGEDPVYRWAEHENNSAYLVYPNPASDKLKIKNLSAGKTIYVQVHDLTGKCIFSTEVNDWSNQREIEIDLPDQISMGSYIVRIKSELLTEDHPIVLIK